MNYFGDIVFAFSSALVTAGLRTDILGIVLIGMVSPTLTWSGRGERTRAGDPFERDVGQPSAQH